MYFEEQPFAEEYSVYHRFITRRLVRRAHAKGKKVNAWTVNDPKRARRLRAKGVDGIITDRPDIILRAFM